MNVDIKNVPDGVSFEWESHEAAVQDTAELAKKMRLDGIICSNKYSNYGYGSSREWYGCDGWYEGIMLKLEKGWPEMRELAMKMASELGLDVPVFPTNTTLRKRKRRRDDHGDTLDMGRVWNGQLDTAWERPVHVEKQAINQKRVTLAFDIASNAHITNDVAMWRTALCMLLVDGIARAGRTMEIWVTCSSVGSFVKGPRRLWQGWCVKKTNDPIVPDRLAGMFSVGYLRTMGFTGMHCGEWKVSSGFGSTLNYGLPKTLLDRQNDGETVLRIGECYSKQQAVKEYTRAFKLIDVEAA